MLLLLRTPAPSRTTIRLALAANLKLGQPHTILLRESNPGLGVLVTAC
jgi:hypothetical protein